MDTDKTKSQQNEWRRGWVIVMSAFFIAFITDGLIFSFGIMLVEIVDYFGTGRAVTGAMVSIILAIKHVIGPIAGSLSEKYGNHTIVVFGALLSTAGFILSSFATSVYQLWITYGLLGGLGFGWMVVPSQVCVLQHFERHRTLANGITVCGSGAGTVVFNYFSRVLIDQYGWRGTFLLEAGFISHGVIFGLLLSGLSSKDCTSKITSLKSFLSSVFKIELLQDMKFMMFLLSTLIVSLAFIIPFTFVPDQAKQIGINEAKAAILTSTIGIANIVSRVIVGWIGDRLCFSRFLLFEITILLIGVLTGLSPLMNTFETKLVYTSMYGFLIGGYVTLLTVVLVDIVGEDLIMNTFGLVQLSIGIGVSAATPIAGLLFDLTESYDIAFIVCGAEFVLAGFFLLMSKLCRTINSYSFA